MAANLARLRGAQLTGATGLRSADRRGSPSSSSPRSGTVRC